MAEQPKPEWTKIKTRCSRADTYRNRTGVLKHVATLIPHGLPTRDAEGNVILGHDTRIQITAERELPFEKGRVYVLAVRALSVVLAVALSGLLSGCVARCKACWVPGYLQGPERQCEPPWVALADGGCLLVTGEAVACPTQGSTEGTELQPCPAPELPRAVACDEATGICPEGYDRCEASPGFCCPVSH